MLVNLATLNSSEAECTARAHEDRDEWAGLFCDVIWDGLLCWPPTPAGTLVTAPCPQVFGRREALEMEPRVASKLCEAHGQWLVHEELGNPWTNFTLCLGNNSLATPGTYVESLDETRLYKRWFPVVKTVSQVGYGVSLVTLLLAMGVLASNRRLRCARNSLHMHLFSSFLLRAAMTLLKDHLFVQGVSLSVDVVGTDGSIHFTGTWQCKLLTSVWIYSMMGSYSWILMEGLYLHNLIFRPLSSDNAVISSYVALGWGLPAVFMAPWVGVRAQLEDTLCWTTHFNKYLYLLIRVPMIGLVLVSFALFLNIVRVLRTKLRTRDLERQDRRHFRYSRWARATLVLVPLFGAHYALFLGMSYYVDVDQTVEIVWLFCDQLFGSFQGCCVSLLYCLLNGEVRGEVARKWRSWRLRRQPPRTGSLSSAAAGAAPPPPSSLFNMTELQDPEIADPTFTRTPSGDTCL